MTVVEFFDENKVEHIQAYIYLSKTGFWPEDFYKRYLSDLEVPKNWQFEIVQILANAYVSNFMYFHTVPEPVEYEYKNCTKG